MEPNCAEVTKAIKQLNRQSARTPGQNGILQRSINVEDSIWLQGLQIIKCLLEEGPGTTRPQRCSHNAQRKPSHCENHGGIFYFP